jgi:hypothetical protein
MSSPESSEQINRSIEKAITLLKAQSGYFFSDTRLDDIRMRLAEMTSGQQETLSDDGGHEFTVTADANGYKMEIPEVN